MKDFDDLQTFADVLTWGEAQFEQASLHYGHGTDNPWDDAVNLALHAIGIANDAADKSLLERSISLAERNAILTLFQERIQRRIPAAYLTGTATFAGLLFTVNEDVMIPRSPIAELIENGFSPWVDPVNLHSVLDLCTGSGCIAIASAVCLENLKVDAVDISTKALAVAHKNVARHQCASNVTLIESDLFEAVSSMKYDLIVSNPPYVPQASIDALPQEYTHEPSLAFEADIDGLRIVQRILREAVGHLSEHGCLIVEVGEAAEALMAAYPHTEFTWIDFSRGGDGVFVLTKNELEQMHEKENS